MSNIMLYIENKNLYECDFEHLLQDRIYLNADYKCGLLECVLPQDIKVNQFKYGRKIFLNLVWIKEFKMSDFFPVKERSNIVDLQTSENYHDMQVEFEIRTNIKTLESFLNVIKEKSNKIIVLDFMQKFFNQRFKYAYVNGGWDVKFPKIEYNHSTGKFQNTIGKIYYSGVKYEQARKYFEESVYSKMDADQILNKDPIRLEKEAIAHVFFNFDEKLHNIMGYDPNKYPNIIYKNDYNREVLIQHNNGISDRKCTINEIDTIYIHCNILKESFCSDKKRNILQIFQRKYNSSEKLTTYIFENPLFIPINIKEINSIHFKITNKFGDIAFVDGEKLSMKLVFQYGSFR